MTDWSNINTWFEVPNTSGQTNKVPVLSKRLTVTVVFNTISAPGMSFKMLLMSVLIDRYGVYDKQVSPTHDQVFITACGTNGTKRKAERW